MEEVMEKLKSDPFAAFLEMETEEIREGYARISMGVKREMLNFHGTANGGVIFSLADAAFAVASNSYGQTSVGINMNISFMAAGFEGDRLTAVAEEETKNPRLGLYRIKVFNQKEELIAAADGIVYRKKEKFAGDTRN